MDPKEMARAALEAARAIAVKAEAENRDMTEDETLAAAGHLKEYEGHKKAMQAQASADKVKSDLAAIGADLGLEQNDQERELPSSFKAPTRRFETIGEMFVKSPEYKGLMGQFGNGMIPDRARVQSAPMGVKALVTGLSDTSGGAFVQNDVTNIFERLGRRELTLRDLISVRQTTSDTVEFVQQTTAPSSAAVVAEATTAALPTQNQTTGALINAAGGGYKPEGSIAFVKVTATVKTIAEWIPATKRGLADAAQLRGLIDDELRADLAEEEEDQILNGSGTGENILGILATSGIQAQAYTTDLLTTIRKAKTKVRTVGRVIPTGIVLNPVDAEALDLLKGSDGQFYGPGPFNGGLIRTVWGLPIVESEAIAAGVGLVGDFRKAVLWDRQQATITATDSHADFFIRNLVAILGEERVAFGVTRPAAFVNVDLTP